MAATKTIKFMSEKKTPLLISFQDCTLIFFAASVYIQQMFILIPNEFGCIESKAREDKSIFSILV